MASSSSSSTMPSATSSSIPVSYAAAASSRPLADTAFPVLGSSPSRPRSRRAARPPRPLRRGEERRIGGKTPGYTVDRDNVGTPLGSLYGRADDAAPAKTAATAEAGTTSAAPPTSSVPSKAGKISARPPTCAAPGSFAAAVGVLSGLPVLLPAVQAFGGYSFGYTMGDLFQDLELLQVELPDLRQHPQVVDEPRHPPPLRFHVQPTLRPQMLQAPRYFNAPAAQFSSSGLRPSSRRCTSAGSSPRSQLARCTNGVRPTQLAAPHHHPTPFQFEHQQGPFKGFVRVQERGLRQLVRAQDS